MAEMTERELLSDAGFGEPRKGGLNRERVFGALIAFFRSRGFDDAVNLIETLELQIDDQLDDEMDEL